MHPRPAQQALPQAQLLKAADSQHCMGAAGRPVRRHTRPGCQHAPAGLLLLAPPAQRQAEAQGIDPRHDTEVIRWHDLEDCNVQLADSKTLTDSDGA